MIHIQEINAEIRPGGGIIAQIEEFNGPPRKGFSFEDCDEFSDDAVHHRMSWQGSTNVSQVAGRIVQVSFRLRNARFYAFQFVERGPRD